MENGHRRSRDGHSQRRDSSQFPLQEDAGQRKDALRQWNLPQCLLSFEYWVLWLAMYIGIGSGFTFLNNLGEFILATLQVCMPCNHITASAVYNA